MSKPNPLLLRCTSCNCQLVGKQVKHCAACKPPSSAFNGLKGLFREIDARAIMGAERDTLRGKGEK